MKKLLVSLVVLALCFGGAAYFFKDEIQMFALRGDLQALLDFAAKTPSKTARLFGLEYRVEKPVVLGAEHSGLKINGGGAKVSGMRKIEGWKKSERFAGAWEAPVDCEGFITSLFVNGRRAECARAPNTGRFLAHSRVENGSQHGSCEAMHASVGQGGDIFLKLSNSEIYDAFIGSFRNWVQVNVPIKSAKMLAEDGDKKVLVEFAAPLGTSMFRNCKYPNFIIYNVPQALDCAGEFYFDRSKRVVYYLPRAGEDMQTAVAEFPFVEIPFSVQGKFDGANSAAHAENIRIEGVSFSGGAVGCKPELQKKGVYAFLCDGQSAASSISTVKVELAKNIVFKDCAFEKADSYGLWLGLGVQRAKVQNCVFFDLGLGGMKIGIPSVLHRTAMACKKPEEVVATSDIEIADNIIYHYGRFSMSGAGILAFDVARCKIEHNEIFDGFYTGISYGWCWGAGKTSTVDTSISFNKIHDLSFGNTNDLGGIYTLGTSPNSKIEGNVIWNINCLDYGAFGIYNDEGSDGWSIFKNYVRNSSKGGYFMHYGKGCKIFNNIIRDCRDYQTGLGRKEPGSIVFERNIIEFSAPATVLRKNQLIRPEAGKFDYNFYYPKNCELSFGGLSFAQWRKLGQDAHSLVGEIDIDKMLSQKTGFDKIGFEPVDISAAGARGAMAEKAAKIRADYKYPPLFKHSFKVPAAIAIDDFIGAKPAADCESSSLKSINVLSENGMRFVRIRDDFKDYRPYFSYGFALDDYDFIKTEFMLRLSENSNLLLEYRESWAGGAGNPRMHISNAHMMGQKLPVGKWLKVEVVVPNHVNPDKHVDAKIFDGDKLIAEKSFPYNSSTAKFYRLYVIAFNGGSGEITDIAKLRVSPLK